MLASLLPRGKRRPVENGRPSDGPLSPLNIAVLLLSPVVAAIGFTFYLGPARSIEPDAIAIFAVMSAATALSITAGYHRYYSHRSYECSGLVQAFYLLFGAAALQNSVLCWASNHRDHHRFVDTNKDPHTITRGRFWTYIGWIFYRYEPDRSFVNVRDLMDDPLVCWQHRNYVVLGLGVGFGLPLGAGILAGSPLDALFLGGLVRVVLLHHLAFLGNLAGHSIGRQNFSTRDSSRDSAWLSLLTLGEGQHNFHHTFPGDYRGSVRRFDWNPTKWWIAALGATGLAWGLHRTARVVTLRSRVRVDSLQAASPEGGEKC